MGVINVLDKHTADLIAAGEVVERPASVIKELVENSIDAGATAITVEIKNGGSTFMRVNDNGCGIMREDIKKAFLPHATSKVKTEDDLDSICTLGFRGEALSSISAVAKVELITKNKDEEIGSYYIIEGSQEVSLKDAGCPNGTTFIIRDLFYNIPARMKFLKKDVSEGNAVSNVIDKIALSHPEIAFTYIKDSKLSLKTTGDGKLKSAIYAVYGREFANNLIPLDYTLNSVHVYGYISKPVFARANRNMQNFFINGRYVKSTTASAALENACKGSVMVGKFPSCVMNIDLSYEAVDVNVHPAKIEVRFINERPIFDAVYHAVKTALLKGDERKQVVLNNPFTEPKKINPFEMAQKAFAERKKEEAQKAQPKPLNPFEELDNVFTKKSTENNVRPEKHSSFTHTFTNQEIDSFSMADSEDPLSIYSKQAVKANEKKLEIIEKAKQIKSEQIISDEFSASENNEDKSSDKTIESECILDSFEEKTEEQKPALTSSLRFIGEAFSTYIIVEKNSKELLLIDKHAAHERIIYEKLKKEKGTGFSQMLLAPVAVTLNKLDYNNAIENLNLFSELGFDVENFGNGVLLVRSAPQYLENVDISETIVEIAGYISENKIDINTEKMDFVYHNIACRAAIKAGAKSTPQELMVIVNKLESDNTLRYCPHGRPVCIVLSKYEIEKQFGRV